MKKLLAILSVIPSLAFGLTIQNPYNQGIIHQLATLMSGDVSSLFVPHNATETYKSIVFTTDVFTSGKFYTDVSPEFSGTFQSLGEDLFFREVPNYSSFTLGSSTFISFIGNESMDRNKLLIEYGNITSGLFDYRSGASNSLTPAPTTAHITTDSPTEVRFSHQNPIAGVSYQENPLRFKMFQAYDPVSGDGSFQFIFAIDDRENDLIDHDDGFFFLTSDGQITPVPEPSTIGLLAIVGLFGVLYLKRRKSNK